MPTPARLSWEEMEGKLSSAWGMSTRLRHGGHGREKGPCLVERMGVKPETPTRLGSPGSRDQDGVSARFSVGAAPADDGEQAKPSGSRAGLTPVQGGREGELSTAWREPRLAHGDPSAKTALDGGPSTTATFSTGWGRTGVRGWGWKATAQRRDTRSWRLATKCRYRSFSEREI